MGTFPGFLSRGISISRIDATTIVDTVGYSYLKMLRKKPKYLL
jgi:hypothetical protein